MTAKTATERVRALRARMAARGLAEVRGVYLPTSQHQALKQAAKDMEKTITSNGVPNGKAE